jgi:hypothetical protein
MLAVVPIPLQQRFWNESNSSTGRTRTLDAVSSRRTKIVCEWLSALGRTDLNIIEVGRGAAWFSPKLARYGRLTRRISRMKSWPALDIWQGGCQRVGTREMGDAVLRAQ